MTTEGRPDATDPLAALGDAVQLDPQFRVGLDRVTRLAAQFLQAPAALVNIVEGARELCLSAYDPSGRYFAGSQSPIDASLCAHVADRGEPLVVDDAREHPLVRDNPAVCAGRVTAFLGVPLISPQGQVLGTLCAIDRQPRQWTEEQVELLCDLAAGVLTEVDLRQAERELAVRERERERLSRELEVERRRLYSIFEQAPAFIAAVRGPNHVFELANPSYDQLVGHRDLLGRRVHDALPELEGQGIIAILDRVYQTGEPFVADALPVLLQRTPGSGLEERVLNFVYQPLEEMDGSTSGILVHGVDVTDQMNATTRLAAAEAHYRRLVDSSPQIIFALDAEGRFTEVNAAGSALLGRPAEEVMGQQFAEVVDPADLGTANEMFHRLISGEVGAVELELQIRRASEETRLISISVVAIGEGDAVVGAHGVARDITEDRMREERMRLLTTVLESLTAAVSITDESLRVVFANGANDRLLGCEPGGYCGRSVTEFLPDETARGQVGEIRKALEQAGQWSGRIWRRRLDDGRVVPLDAVIGAVRHDSGTMLIFTVAHDATETIDAERRLRRAERLASVGTLISGVTHELNNPIHAVRGLSELLIRSETTPERREDLEVVQREADRMAKIVADLRQVAHHAQDEDTRAANVDLNAVVRQVVQTRDYSLSTRNVEVHLDLDPALPSAWGCEGQLEQVVLNLLVNAEQAVSAQDGVRRVSIRTHAIDTGISLRVSDNGAGIPCEHLERIFDPFWTTREPGEGTGLGLSLVHRIVTETGGEIQVESQVGEGAAFRITLPRAPRESARPAPVAADDEGAVSRPLRVLVVDDEPANRLVVRRVLKQRGHHTDEADEGGAALRLLDDNHYDVIVSDLRMPGLGGEELLRRLQENGQGMERRLIFVTGDVSDPRTARTLADAGVPVMLKPVGFKELAHAIESMASERISAGE